MKSLASLVVSLLLGASGALAAPIISNLPQTNDLTGALICESDGATGCAANFNSVAAMGFRMQGTGYTLTSVDLHLSFAGDPTLSGGAITR